MPGADLSDNRRQSVRTKKPKKNKNGFFAIVAGLCIFCIAAAAAISYPILAGKAPFETGSEEATAPPESEIIEESDKIYDNIFINDIPVGGLTREEAAAKLKSETDKVLAGEINLVYESKTFTYSLKSIGAAYDIDAAINTAYATGRQGSNSERKKEIDKLKTNKLELEAAFSLDSASVSRVVEAVAAEIDTPPVNAKMERLNGEFVITPEQNGLTVNQEKTMENLMAAASQKSGDAEIVCNEEIPEYTEESFLTATALIGSYYTVISGSEANRNKNLDTASSKINDYVLYPGEIFSTNVVFGEMTAENGYRMAPVIIGGELSNGMGGGVCQISSTLYMALLHAELEIVERRNHSQKVGYADYGYDATLAGDYIDLKFKNDTDYPLTIESYIEGNKAYVNLYGYEKHNAERRLEFYNVLTGTVPAPDERIVEDATLPIGEKNVVTSARNGVNYDLYKIVYNGNEELQREKINTSKYLPRGAVIHVGTGVAVSGQGASSEEPPAPSASAAPQTTPSPEPTPAVETPSQTPPATQEPEPSPTNRDEPPLIIIDPVTGIPSIEKPPVID